MAIVTEKIAPAVSYQSSVIQTLSQFEEMAEEWNTFLSKAGISSINMDHSWLVTYLKHFSPLRLCIVLVRNSSQELVAAAPFAIKRYRSGLMRRMLRHVQFIGSDPFVYEWMKIISLPDEDKEQIFSEISCQLLSNKNLWDVIDLRYALELEQMALLGRHLCVGIYEKQILLSSTSSYLPLPKTMKEYESSMKKNIKSNINRYLNRLKADYPKEKVYLETKPFSEESKKGMAIFFQAHIDYWKGKKQRSDLDRFPELNSFYREIHKVYDSKEEEKRKRVELSYLKIGKETMSTILGFWQLEPSQIPTNELSDGSSPKQVRSKDDLYETEPNQALTNGTKRDAFLAHLLNYNPIFKKYNPGVLHYRFLIERIIETGGAGLDMGRGDESYKNRWTDIRIPLWNLMVFRTEWAFLLWQSDIMLKTIYSLRDLIEVRFINPQTPQ